MADDATPPAPPPDEPRPARRTYELPNVLGVPTPAPEPEPPSELATTVAVAVRLLAGAVVIAATGAVARALLGDLAAVGAMLLATCILVLLVLRD